METISIREAAERLGVSHKVVRRLISRGLVTARKVTGAHGAEWSVEVASLEAYRSGSSHPAREKASLSPRSLQPSVREPSASPSGGRAAAPTDRPAGHGNSASPELLEDLRQDRRFLQEHVAELTALLRDALAAPSPIHGAPPSGSTGENGKGIPESLDEESGAAVAETRPSPHLQPDPAPAIALRGVTEALQSSLRSIRTQDIAALEMCSVKVLWGKPVLWRVVAENADDVASLVGALLSPEAMWIPPGEEVHFLWARDAAGEVVWGTACGAGWFGEPFPEALRTARVERR